jgi:hypothetical protein
MNYWLAQFLSALGGPPSCLWQEAGGLAARNSDEKDNGWAQILAFVILAIFYAVGSIVKARANKTAPKGKEQIPRKPARKPPETIEIQLLKQFRRPEKPVAKPQIQPTRRKVARPATALVSAEARRAEAGRSAPYGAGVTSPQPAGMAMLEPQMAMPQVQPKLEKVTAGVAAPEKIPQTTYLPAILSDYDNSEKLRRAILHYEILGKPLSLREPGEHIIGL